MAPADVSDSLEKIGAEHSVSRVLHVACGELVELLDATFASVSRVIGDLLVELSGLPGATAPSIRSSSSLSPTTR